MTGEITRTNTEISITLNEETKQDSPAQIDGLKAKEGSQLSKIFRRNYDPKKEVNVNIKRIGSLSYETMLNSKFKDFKSLNDKSKLKESWKDLHSFCVSWAHKKDSYKLSTIRMVDKTMKEAITDKKMPLYMDKYHYLSQTSMLIKL